MVPAASAQVRDRLASGMRQVDGLPVLIVSGIAALVMTGGELVLRRHHEDETDEHDLSVTAVLLDTIADAAAAGVAAKGAIILATDGWYWLDPAVALTIALVVAYHAIALIRKVLIRLRPAVADGSGEPSGTSAQRRRIEEMTLPDGLIHLPAFLIEAEERRCWRSPSCTPVHAA